MARIQKLEAARTGNELEHASWRSWLAREVRARPARNAASQALIGIFAGLVAVAARFSLPLEPEQLPTLTVVVALAIVTTFVGVWAGIATAVVGGMLSWYLFFNPYSWNLGNGAWIPLFGFTVIASVILITAQLYRSTARAIHGQQLAKAQAQAENAELFAREMAHRLKNALAIVQALAFQTIGSGNEDAGKFAARLKALADANDLLSERVDTPAAMVTEVVNAALSPFGELRGRFDLVGVDALIPSQQVVSLALALHELTTNAMKYGALSSPSGRVAIDVRYRAERLCLTWKEAGGPSVAEPEESGFGTRLLRRSGVNTELAFEPDGLRCSIGLRTK